MTFRTRFQYLFDKAADIAHGSLASNPAERNLPPLFFFTDPARTPHPEDIAAHLPAGCGIVYRHFGEHHALQRARLLKTIARDLGLTLLIGKDRDLALEIEADGIHLPERSLDQVANLRQTYPQLILTAACHGHDCLRRPAISEGRVDAVFVSPVFVSGSASARGVHPLGLAGAKEMAEASAVPVYGLGGINCDTIARLHDCGLAGVAAVDAFNLKD